MLAKTIKNGSIASIEDLIEEKHAPKISEDAIILHTKLAQALWRGEWKMGKMGLVQFAARISILFSAAKANDPYAEWFLLKTFKAITEACEKIDEIEKTANSYFEQFRGITVVLWEEVKPKCFPMHFSNKFSSIAAYKLVAKADYVIRQILTLDKYGVLLNQDKVTKRKVMNIVQEVFSIPMKWRNTSVSREDIALQNTKAVLARNYMGSLPDAVLNRKITLPIMPTTKGKK